MSLEQPRIGYDYATALGNLQAKIQQLSSSKQQIQGPPQSRLGATWGFLKQNRGSLVLVFAMYSMSTASMVAAMMAESRLKGELLLEQHEQQQLQQQICRLHEQVQRQQQLLDSLQADMQSHTGSSWFPGWPGSAAAARRQMLHKVQQWQQQQHGAGDQQQLPSQESTQKADDRRSSSSSRGSGSAGGSSQQEFGVRVGKFGQGFII